MLESRLSDGEQRNAYERQFLEQTYLRLSGDIEEQEVRKLSIEQLVNEIKEKHENQDLSQTYIKYAKRDEELLEEMTRVVLNGEKNKFNQDIKDFTQNVTYGDITIKVPTHILRLTPKEGENHTTGIKKVDLRLKSIEPSIKAKFRQYSRIEENQIFDASGSKVITNDYDSMMRTIETICKKFGVDYMQDKTSPMHKIIAVRVHNKAVSDNDMHFLNKWGINVTEEKNTRKYQAVHINIQNGGKHNIAEIQVATASMDKKNTYGDASHLKYQKIKAADLIKYKPRDLEIVCTYEIVETKKRKGDSKITVDIESPIAGEVSSQVFKILSFMENKLRNANYDDRNCQYKMIGNEQKRYQIEFYAPSKLKNEIMIELDEMVGQLKNQTTKINNQILEKYNILDNKVMTF